MSSTTDASSASFAHFLPLSGSFFLTHHVSPQNRYVRSRSFSRISTPNLSLMKTILSSGVIRCLYGTFVRHRRRRFQDQAPVDGPDPGQRQDALCHAAAQGPGHRRSGGRCRGPRRPRVHHRDRGGERDGPAPCRFPAPRVA